LSTWRTSGRHAGFTLLEIVVSLAIVSILGTLFAVSFAGDSTEERLREPANALKRLARTANRQAAAFRDDYRITFFEDGYFLSRAALPDRRAAEESAIESYRLRPDAGVTLEIRRAGGARWIRPDGDEWLFQPAGLSEPIAVRFSRASSFIELTFNPMTAAVDSERSRFP
jgi:prepilin-type N-terminal cleavage/methylation domain-containing protein